MPDYTNYLNALGQSYGVNPSPAIDTALPGFSGLSNQATSYLNQLLSGGRTSAQTGAMRQRQAEQSWASGMPNTQNIGGTLMGNSALRDERDFAGGQQAKGFQGLLDMLSAYSGNVFPTANALLAKAPVLNFGDPESFLGQNRSAGSASWWLPQQYRVPQINQSA